MSKPYQILKKNGINLEYLFDFESPISRFSVQFASTQQNLLVQIKLSKRNNDKSLRPTLKKGNKWEYTYQVNEQFFTSNGIQNEEPQFISSFIEQNFDKFDCENPKQLKYDKLNLFTLLSTQFFDPYQSLFRAVAAFKIIKLIQQEKWIKYSRENLWNQLKDQISKFNQCKEDIVQEVWQKTQKYFQNLFTFSIQNGYSYDKRVFTQKMFENASYQQNRLIFNPTSTTSQIFQAAKTVFDNMCVRPKIHIHGQGGIDKSISQCLMVLLFDEVTNLRLHFKITAFKDFFSEKFIDWKEFQKIPKVFYYSMEQEENETNFNCSIKAQLPVYFLQEQQNKKLTKNSELVFHISEYYEEKNIPILYLIDQIDKYYSLARQFFEYKSKGNKQKEQSYKEKIEDATFIMTCIQRQAVIFGSSENIQQSLTSNQYSIVYPLKNKINGKRIKIQSPNMTE